MSKPNTKIDREIGKDKLKKAMFRFERTAGQGELWFNRNNVPVFVTYFGIDAHYFDAASLDNALSMKDETI
jgi:hypothetical protein